MADNDKDLMEMLFKINEMIGPKGDFEDRGGHCGLIDFAEKIENLPKDSKEWEIFERALRFFAPFLSKMPSPHIINLGFLIGSTKTPVEVYGDAFLKALDKWVEAGLFGFGDGDNIFQKALILRYLAEKKRLSADRILAEQKIRGRYPWYWMDAMVHYDIVETIKEMTFCFKCEWGEEHEKVRELLMRLPQWIRLWGEKRLTPIKELDLKKENKEKIEHSFESRRAVRK